MNRIVLSGPVFKEPKHNVAKGRETLKWMIDTGCSMISEVVPETIRRYKPDAHNGVWIWALDDMAGSWWGSFSEGDMVTVEGVVTTVGAWKWCYVVPYKIEVAPCELQNFAEITGSVSRDDKIVYCWDRDGVMHDEMLPESEITAIEHPLLMRDGDGRLIKVKTYGENAFEALTHDAGDTLSIKGPLNFWSHWGKGHATYDYAVLAKEIKYGGRQNAKYR